ncbi:MAG: hypothetical protein ACXV5L_13325, partial [Thermoanaerobaculia bacterium]
PAGFCYPERRAGEAPAATRQPVTSKSFCARYQPVLTFALSIQVSFANRATSNVRKHVRRLAEAGWHQV